MSVPFKITYQVMGSDLAVTQGSQPAGPFSLFSRCAGHPFAEWADLLPEYCRTEGNDRYTLDLETGRLHGLILEQVFRGDGNCKSVRLLTPRVKDGDRLRWAAELVRRYGLMNRLYLEVGVHSIRHLQRYCAGALQRKGNGEWTMNSWKDLPVSLVEAGSGGGSVRFLSSQGEFPVQNGTQPTDGPQVCILVEGQGVEYLRRQQEQYLFRCGAGALEQFLQDWCCEFLLPELFRRCCKAISASKAVQTSSDPMTVARREMLTRDRPYLKLEADKQLWTNQTGKLRLWKLPEDMRCTVSTGDGSIAVLGQGGVIFPRKGGTVRLTAACKDDPGIRDSVLVEVREYRTVRAIRLSGGGGTLMEGDQITVHASYDPPNANNIGKGSWSVSPAGAAEPVAPGRFRIKKAGSLTITHRVEGVSQSLNLTAFSLPKQVKLSAQTLSVRLGDNSRKLVGTVLPAGARGGQLSYRVYDSGILELDPVSGSITPKAEGSTVVNVLLLDNNGRTIHNDQCLVTVLPIKDVVTPELDLVAFLLSVLSTAVLFGTQLRLLGGTAAAVSAAVYAYRHRTGLSYGVLGLGVLTLLAALFL